MVVLNNIFECLPGPVPYVHIYYNTGLTRPPHLEFITNENSVEFFNTSLYAGFDIWARVDEQGRKLSVLKILDYAQILTHN